MSMDRGWKEILMNQLSKKFKLGVEHIRIPIGDEIYCHNDVDYLYVGKQLQNLLLEKVYGFYKIVQCKFIGITAMEISSMEQFIVFRVKYRMVPRKYEVKEKCVVRLKRLRKYRQKY